ncbi:MAG: DUF481 domain-containing protein [Gemmatimonadales bacterium]
MVALLLAALSVSAAPDTGKHVFFTGNAGLITTKGNAEITSVDVGDKFIVTSGPWKFTQTAGVTYARNHDSVTAELWRGDVRGDRAIGGRASLYGAAEFERNTFAGIRLRSAQTLGLSVIAEASAHDTLRAEVGGGYSEEKAVPPGADRNYAAGRAAIVYHRSLGPKASVDQTVEYLPNFKTSQDYRINSETAITAPISRAIAMKASYVIRYEGLPQPGFENTDTILVTGVQITL